MKRTPKNFEAFVRDYRSGQYSNQELARRYRVSAATITTWSRKAGLPQRRPGRLPVERPTARQLQIIELCLCRPQVEVARKFGISKQAVNSILRRWGAELPRIAKGKGNLRSAVNKQVKGKVVSFRLSEVDVLVLTSWVPGATPGQAARDLILGLLSVIRKRKNFNPYPEI